MLRSLVRSLLVAILAEAVIVWNTGSVLRERGAMVLDLESRRFWEDLSLAVGYYKTGDLPVSYDAVERWKDATGGSYYRERGGALTRGAVRAGLSPWHFWRTVPPRHHDRLAFELFPRFDDSGRPLLLGYGFRFLDGVAPFLLYWLGALLAFPLLWALAFEIDRSGRPLAAALATLSLGFSAFLGDALSLSYSAAGFHVLGVLLLSAFAASMCLRAPRPGALLLKALLAGIVFAVLVACRGGALLLGPGFVIAALVGAAKAGAWRPALGLWGVACFLLFLPTALLKEGIERLTERTFASRSRGAAPPQHHAVWFGIWTGLGDFDREKGYVWSDAAASAAMVQRGGSPLRPGAYDPKNERILRDAVVADILNDPGWYAGILARRAAATLSQSPILPWPPLNGASTRFSSPVIESYYSLTAHVDVLRLYPLEVEFPFVILLLANLSLLPARRWSEALLVVCVLAGGIVLPVVVTTGGAIEPMAVGLVYFLGAALAVQVLWTAVRSRRTQASGPKG